MAVLVQLSALRTGHRWNPGSNGIVAGVGLRIVHGGGCFLTKSKHRFFLSVEGVLLVKLARKVPSIHTAK
jgi:hypothetical protein